MGSTEVVTDEGRYRTATFARIVCGINGSRADAETVRQASLLSGSEGRVELVCVLETRGYGLTEQATIAPARAETAMKHALDQVKEVGVAARNHIVHGPSPWDSLAHMAAGADLLVLGSRGGSRRGGIVLGSVATAAVHRAELPVLVARPAPGAPFPERILLASDGSLSSQPATDLAVTIARVHRSEITLFTAGDDATAEQRHRLAEQATQIEMGTGRAPIVTGGSAPARSAIAEFAARELPSLVVVGSGGKQGVRALGSVSEHVAHEVSCSVLVARGPHAEEAR